MSRDLALLNDAIGTLVEFGVACTFTPASGPPRQVVAVLKEDGSYGDGQTERRVETLSAFVLRDPETETYGGIGEIQRGDTLRINSDTEERRFGYADRFAERDAVSWKLFFERRATTVISGNNRK